MRHIFKAPLCPATQVMGKGQFFKGGDPFYPRNPLVLFHSSQGKVRVGLQAVLAHIQTVLFLLG